MAEVTAQAQRPDVDLLELTIGGLNGDADKDGLVHPVLMWKFHNTGGSAFTVKDVIFGVWSGIALPPEMPQGIRVDGDAAVIANSITSDAFYLTEPYKFNIPKETVDQVIRGDSKLFFYAKFEYWDNLKNEHARCFGREFKLKNGAANYSIPSGGEAYQCNT
jgi:hypothetical protein